MATDERSLDREIIAEAQRERNHALDIAKINAERDRSIAETNRRLKEARLPYLVGAVAIVVVGTIVCFLVSWGIQNTNNDDNDRTQQKARQDQITLQVEENRATVAKSCIDAGNVWINGNTCIQVGKDAAN